MTSCPRRRVLALACGLAAAGLGLGPAPAAAQRLEFPARGSALRATLMDAARPNFEAETGGPVEFVVRRLAVQGPFAFGILIPQRPGGGAIDWRRTAYAETIRAGVWSGPESYVLWQRRGGAWRLATYAIGPSDVAWEGWISEFGAPAALFEP